MKPDRYVYQQSTGRLTLDGYLVGLGYSGAGPYKNKPEAQDRVREGPIPTGLWQIGAAADSSTHGPFAIRLTPTPATYTYGRSAFLIHGDNAAHPGMSSQGCIILGAKVRHAIIDTAIPFLEVVA